MFLRKLGLRVGRLDFWNITKELTAYELAVHEVAEAIEPTGEDRDDLRAAWTTGYMIAANAAKPLSDDEIRELLRSLREYLEINREPEREATLAEISAMIGA